MPETVIRKIRKYLTRLKYRSRHTNSKTLNKKEYRKLQMILCGEFNRLEMHRKRNARSYKKRFILSRKTFFKLQEITEQDAQIHNKIKKINSLKKKKRIRGVGKYRYV